MSFLIVTYNSTETIEECIGSILAQEMNPLEVLVVDNASTDGTPDFVHSEFSSVVVRRNTRNVGFGAANNVAARLARGELVAMVNPDAALDPGWSSEITNVIESNPGCAAAEGKLLLANQPELINCAGSSINLLGFGCMNHYGEPISAAAHARLVGYASGAAFAMRREVFLGVGGFDESYFLYQDDVDLGLRIHEAGWQIRYTPNAIAYHHYKSELGANKVRYLERNRWKTLAKHMPIEYFIKCAPLLAVAELGIVLTLAKTSLFRQKAMAALEFIESLPETLDARKSVQRQRLPQSDVLGLLTHDFPEVYSGGNLTTRIAGKLLKGYQAAFLGDR